jgi:hypothetical protein
MSKKILTAFVIISMIICSSLLIGQGSSDTSYNPTKLEISVNPPSLPADNNTYNCISLQLQDTNGNPARALQDTTISLSSSITEIGTVDQTVTIPKGSTYTTANFYATFTPGTTIITAAATGFTTVQSPVATVGPKPYTIGVYGFPSTLPADAGAYEAAMVQLQDASFSPAKAPRGGTEVTLSCSNVTVGDVTAKVTISEGQTYATATFYTTSSTGQAVVTAIASDYGATSTTITTLPQSPTSSGKLLISTGPTKVLADNTAYKQVAVQIMVDGALGSASSDLAVTIASADESICKTETQITIPASKTYALATLSSTYKAGTTKITAAATNFEAASQTITTTGYTASKLAVYIAPATIPSDKAAYQVVQVQLQDAQGRPAKAPVDLTVNLFSSQPTVAAVNPKVTIPFGKTCTTGTLTVTNSPGEAAVTAQASGYTTSQATLTTYTIDFSKLAITLTANPQSIFNANTTEIIAYITAENNPITGATLQFTSNNNGTFTETHEDQDGYYKTTFTAPSFSKTTTCTITVNASKTGFLSALGTTQITVVLPPMAGTNVNSTGNNVSSNKLQLYIKDSSGNYVSDALVCSINQSAGSQALSGTTNATGYVTFKNVANGSYTFEITKTGYTPLEQTFEFKGNPRTVVLMLSAEPQNDNTLLIIGAAVIAVVIVVIGIVLVKRRKPSKNLEPLTWPTTL